MFGFHWVFTRLLGTARSAVGSQLQAEMAVGAAVARAEFYAEAERAAAAFDAQDRPELAAAVRAEVARLRAEDAGTPPVPPAAVGPAPPAAALPPALPRKPAKKAAPSAPPPSAPFAPPPARNS